MLRRVALTVVALAVLAGPALGQQVNLHWKFKVGDKFYLEEKMTGQTKVSALGMEVTEKQSQHRVSSFVVKDVTPEGIVLEQRIELWKTQSTGGLGGDRELGDKIQDLFKDVVFVVKMNRAGALTKFEGYDKLLKNVENQLGAAETAMFKSIASEEAIKAPLTMAFDVLPDKAVKKGDKWRKVSDIPMPALGKFTINSELTYDGKGPGGHIILSKGSFAYQPLKDGDANLGFKILKVDLTKNELKSKIVFDADKGRLVVQEMTMPLAGTMKMEAMGMEIDIQLEGTESRTIRLLEKKPLPEI